MARPVDVQVSRMIRAPRDKVAAFAGDPRNVCLWYANICSVEWPEGQSLGIGAKADFVAQFMGRRLGYTYEITACDPGHRLEMRTAQGPFPMRTTYLWQSVHGGTLMTLRNDGMPSGFGALAAPVLAAAMRIAMGKDLARLAAIMEAEGA